jgi:hypothetical protein
VVDEQFGYYKLDNIPFYAPKTASGDIVWAEYNEAEAMLTYRKTIQYSGNSTIHAFIVDYGYDINAISKVFDDMGCESRNMTDSCFAPEVPAGLDYIPIKRMLDELDSEGLLDYAESGFKLRLHAVGQLSD